MESSRPSSIPAPSERRSAERLEVAWDVDCRARDTFLYASISNISKLGIFVQTTEPLETGTVVRLRFAPVELEESFDLKGVVQWINPVKPFSDNPNPGMGIAFTDITLADREKLVEAIHTIAYLRDQTS